MDPPLIPASFLLRGGKNAADRALAKPDLRVYITSGSPLRKPEFPK